MNPGGIPVIKFLFQEDFKVLREALGLREVYDIEEFESANDLATYLSTLPAGLIIISLRDKNDLVQIATLMKLLKKVAKDTAVKIVVINFSGDKIYENAISKLGIQDSIDISINTKALKFKIDFWIKSLKGQIKSTPSAPKEKVAKSQEPTYQQDRTGNLSVPQWTEALKIEDDIWILKSENDCKKILSKWLVRLLGPGPNVGQWYEVKRNLWRFDLREEEKEYFVSGTGAWFFAGEQKPEFVWKESTWMITGHSFELFYKDGASIEYRLKSKNKVLEIAKNSIPAKTKETLIIESFSKEMVFKKEAQILEDLEGEGKTDKLDHDPLSGDVDFHERLAGNLQGEAGKDDPLSKFWGGKSTYKEPSQNDLNGKIKTLNPGENEDKKKKGQEQKLRDLSGETDSEDPLSNFWGGKLQESHGDKKDQSKTRKSEEKKGSNLSGETEGEDSLSGHWGGEIGKKGTSPQVPKYYKDSPLEGQSESDKLSAAFKKGKPSEKAPENVLPFLTLVQEKELADLTADAKVTSYLVVSGKKVSCKLDDHFDNVAIFHTDDKSVKVPHDVELDLIYETTMNDSELKISGNVVTVESDGEGDSYVTVELSDAQVSELQEFLKNLEDRQNNINEFMKRVKGH